MGNLWLCLKILPQNKIFCFSNFETFSWQIDIYIFQLPNWKKEDEMTKVIGGLGQVMFGIGLGGVATTGRVAGFVFVGLLILKLAGLANVGWLTVFMPIIVELVLVVIGFLGMILMAIAGVKQNRYRGWFLPASRLKL